MVCRVGGRCCPESVFDVSQGRIPTPPGVRDRCCPESDSEGSQSQISMFDRVGFRRFPGSDIDRGQSRLPTLGTSVSECGRHRFPTLGSSESILQGSLNRKPMSSLPPPALATPGATEHPLRCHRSHQKITHCAHVWDPLCTPGAPQPPEPTVYFWNPPCTKPQHLSCIPQHDLALARPLSFFLGGGAGGRAGGCRTTLNPTVCCPAVCVVLLPAVCPVSLCVRCPAVCRCPAVWFVPLYGLSRQVGCPALRVVLHCALSRLGGLSPPILPPQERPQPEPIRAIS